MKQPKPPKEKHYSIHKLFDQRWSGRAYTSEALSIDKVQSLFEAARWAPSSFNEQPWMFYAGLKGDKVWDKILGTLVPVNEAWAKEAPLLVLSFAKKYFEHNDKPNRHYMYDVGQAVMSLVLQATEYGWNVHQMGGFKKDMAEEIFDIPEGYDAVTVLAIGERADASVLSEDLKARELSHQKRKPTSEFVRFAE